MKISHKQTQTLNKKKNHKMRKSCNTNRNINPSVSPPIPSLKPKNPRVKNHGKAVIVDEDDFVSSRPVSFRHFFEETLDHKPSASRPLRLVSDIDRDVVDLGDDVIRNDHDVGVIDVEHYVALIEGSAVRAKEKLSKLEEIAFGFKMVVPMNNFVIVDDIVSLGSSSDDGDVVEVKVFSCELCADEKPLDGKFAVKGCDHVYCADCVRSYVSSKLDDGVSVIGCPVPECGGSLEPEYCRGVVSDQVFNRWGDLVCESLIPANKKFYCPFKDCSAMLVNDGSEVVTSSECPNCFRLFCVQCRVVWHEGMACEEVQKMNEGDRSREDLLLVSLAKNQSWKRCPACKIYVERTQGCLYMRCRCGVAFCYSCGNVNNDRQWHTCSNCNKTY